ncbi:chloride channel protein [Lapillicoccus jejuensis]|uniref:H+/Cl-antiporter ClcA n=1 Tax=Lapillicoccus jejuensis TaxID=402171 RepID=A0A542E0C2_9MICO|nr:chloride channel protein [Lapillicoccus jejuensis]TQJ08797.1 H+/Cl- antiporter ClcA [Lapillicoccus jejuensis]
MPYRILSGRGATEQPNTTGDGDVPLTPLFWLATLVTGVAAGLAGIATTELLQLASRLAYGPDVVRGELAPVVERLGFGARFTPLLVAGVVGGVGWYLLRRYVRGRTDVDDAIWTGDGRLGLRRSLGTAALSQVFIGLGASLGREAAPRLLGAAAGSVLAGRLRLSTPQRRLLVACGAGAGLASVYNVPLGAALFTAEVLIGTLRLPVVLPALASSGVATLTAHLVLPDRATYPALERGTTDARTLVWSLLAGPVVGLVAVAFVRLIALVSHRQPRTTAFRLLAPLGACLVLGVVGLAYPQLYGNGQEMAQLAFLGLSPIGLYAVLALLKPLVTCLFLGSGASGGLFTPTLSTGAVLGAALGGLFGLVWPGGSVGAYALLGAAAMLGAGMQAPLAALALVLELTHGGFELLVPLVLVTTIATAVARRVDGYSIYSARLTAEHPPQAT